MIRILAVFLAMALPAGAVETENGSRSFLRVLDKISGDVADLEIPIESSAKFGRLTIAVKECRYPRANPSGDGFAYIVIDHDDQDDPLFSGWMIASSPALNAFDHRRYDVWLLRCAAS